MIKTNRPVAWDTPLGLLLVAVLCLATLTLWIPAYWPVAVFEVSVLLIAGAGVGLRMTPARETRFPLFALGFLVLWGCFQLLTGYTVSRFATERAALQWMTLVAVYYTGVSTLKNESLARSIRLGMVWFGFALTLEAVLQAYLFPGRIFGVFPTGYQDFVMGPIIYHTHFAALVEVLLPLALFLALGEETISFALLGVSALLFTGVVVSASRGGVIIEVVEVVVVFVLLHRRKAYRGRTVRLGALGLIGITAILTLIVGSDTVSQRFSSGALTAGRLQFVVSTLHMIAVHPLTGWGLGCWPAVYPAFATFVAGAIVNQAHCDWLQWTAEGGLAAGLAMFSLAIWAIRPAVQSIWGIGVLAVFIHAAFDYPFSRPAVAAWPVVILAMAAAAYRKKTSPA